MILKQTRTAVGNFITSSFLASGGTPPYSYAVLPGGPGGAINSSTGIYVAPSSGYGVDTIRVTDSLGAFRDADILVTDPIGLLCEIVRTYMGLDEDQVYLWDQKFTIPNDNRTYVPVAVVSSKPFGITSKFNPVTNQSEQSVNILARLDINIMSRTDEALLRKEEVVLALFSDYSRQQQAANGFYIAQLPSSFVNISQEDGAARPYRFVISVNMQYAYRKSQATPYFDNFSDAAIEIEP